MALAEKIMMMARTSSDEIMYDVYVGGIGYTMPEFYNDVYKYVSSEGLAELVRRTRDTVPDNIAYLKERGQDALIRAERCSVLPHVWESPERPPWALETGRMTSA